MDLKGRFETEKGHGKGRGGNTKMEGQGEEKIAP